MKMDVKKAVELIITPAFEGSKFTDIPGDYGGCTRYGVTQNIYNTYRDKHDLARQSVELISMDEVTDVYKIYFWDQSGCDKLIEINYGKLAFVHFNVAINRNPVLAVRMLQSLLGLVNITGYFGPISQEATKNKSEDGLVQEYLEALRQHYLDEVKKDPTQQEFLHGWLNRITNIQAVLATI
jgi:lysozyme family protein